MIRFVITEIANLIKLPANFFRDKKFSMTLLDHFYERLFVVHLVRFLIGRGNSMLTVCEIVIH